MAEDISAQTRIHEPPMTARETGMTLFARWREAADGLAGEGPRQ